MFEVAREDAASRPAPTWKFSVPVLVSVSFPVPPAIVKKVVWTSVRHVDRPGVREARVGLKLYRAGVGLDVNRVTRADVAGQRIAVVELEHLGSGADADRKDRVAELHVADDVAAQVVEVAVVDRSSAPKFIVPPFMLNVLPLFSSSPLSVNVPPVFWFSVPPLLIGSVFRWGIVSWPVLVYVPLPLLNEAS